MERHFMEFIAFITSTENNISSVRLVILKEVKNDLFV